MSDIQSEKLEYFEREIMNRVQAESEAIRAETQRMKDEALEQEKARLYDELYNDIQAQVAQIRKDTAGEIAHETQQTLDALTDDRRTQMSDMQRFCHVWSAVVQDDLLWMLCFFYGKIFICLHLF